MLNIFDVIIIITYAMALAHTIKGRLLPNGLIYIGLIVVFCTMGIALLIMGLPNLQSLLGSAVATTLIYVYISRFNRRTHDISFAFLFYTSIVLFVILKNLYL